MPNRVWLLWVVNLGKRDRTLLRCNTVGRVTASGWRDALALRQRTLSDGNKQSRRRPLAKRGNKVRRQSGEPAVKAAITRHSRRIYSKQSTLFTALLQQLHVALQFHARVRRFQLIFEALKSFFLCSKLSLLPSEVRHGFNFDRSPFSINTSKIDRV